MKSSRIYLLLILAGGFILNSCSSTNRLTIGVTEPPIVHLPSDVQTIGIVNRSLPTEKNKTADNLDKILSIEGKNLDKDGADACLNGLIDELTISNRFSEVKLLDSLNIESPGLGLLPSILSWNTVEQICSENQVDILFVLSFYDTDARVFYDADPVEIEGPLGIKVPAIEHKASIATLVKTGWRIYDPTTMMIHDELVMNKEVVLSGRGINPLKAAEAISGRKDAVLQASTNLGHEYAFRIFPFKTRVSREYFVRGTNNFKIAKRRAQTGDWDGAAELWNLEVTNRKRKIAGRAYYNMAIFSEINGDLDAAVDWASSSYTDFRNKKALRYLNVLKYRIDRVAMLEN